MAKHRVSGSVRLVFVLAGLAQVSQGTSIVFILSANNLVVGADSKTYDFDGRPKANACKITVGNGFVFANAGPLEDEAGPFVTLARNVLRDAKTVSEAATRFDGLIEPRLEALAKRIFSERPNYFFTSVEGKPWFQAAFARVVAGGPQIVVRTYKPIQNRTQIRMRTESSDCLKGCGGMHVGLGYFDAINSAFESPEKIPVVSVAGTIRYLIGLEIAAHPDKVAAPVAILTLDGSGTHWIDAEECQPDK